MLIARRGLDLGVVQELPDHRKTFSQRQGTERKGMAKIMNPKPASSLRP